MEYQNATNMEEMVSYLIRKKKYYEKILELTKKQEEAIQSNNITKLSLITSEKENHIKEIKHLDKHNIKILEELGSNNQNLTLDKPLDSLLNQIQSIISQIHNYDLESISLLHSSIKSTKAKLNRLNKGKRAQHSTRYQGFHPSRFVDIIQ